MYVYGKRKSIRRYRDIIGMYVKAISTVVSWKMNFTHYVKHKAVSLSTMKELKNRNMGCALSSAVLAVYHWQFSLLSGDIYNLYIMKNMSLILAKFSILLAHIIVI